MPSQDRAHSYPQKDHAWQTTADRLLTVLDISREEQRACEVCGIALYFVRDRHTGQLRAFSKEGVDHAMRCKGKTGTQGRLLDTAPTPD